MKARATSFTAILALALAIGANTALFSVIDAVLLRPLAYPHPERIVELMRHYPGLDIWATTATKFAFWQRENHSFSAVAAYNVLPAGLNLVHAGDSERVSAQQASANYFRVFDVQPFIGRTYTAAEDKPGAGHFAVLSYEFWHNRFHADPNVIGKSLSLGGANYVVLGVMPSNFDTPHHPSLWTPLDLSLDAADRANNYAVIARLKPGVSLEQAQNDSDIAVQRFRTAYGADLIGDRESVEVMRYRDYLAASARRPLWILLGAVGFVLLVACANVANLLLARSTARQHELAIRFAVGASRLQIVRQLLTESLLLSMAGALCGCFLASAFLPVLVRLAPPNTPQIAGVAINDTVLLYALLVAVLTGVAFGLFPALESARTDIANPLRETGTRTTASAASNRVRQILVIGEIAVSLILLVGAALLMRTIGNLESVRPGFNPQNVLIMQMSLDKRFADPTALAQLNERVATRLDATRGVISAASTPVLPLTLNPDLPFEIVGRPPATRDNTPNERYNYVSPHYFSTLQVPIVAGRDFSQQDTAQSGPVMIVNRALARKYFPKQDPLGQQILIGIGMGPVFADKPRRIVGMTADMRDAGLDQPAPPDMFIPESQAPRAILTAGFGGMLPLNWVIRTVDNPMAMAERIRREALVVTGDVPMADPKPMEDLVADSFARQRFVMTLLSVFSGLAVLLGVIGLYSVVSYSVIQRTREMGIRSALGARRKDLLQLVVGEGMRLAAIGLAVGIAGALALTRFLESMLYGVSPIDAKALAAVTLLLAAVASLASFVPAYRASQVDPLIALHEP